MKKEIMETIVGFLVIMIAMTFLAYAYNINNSSGAKDGYVLIADFQNVDGLSSGSDIKLSGIKIGVVENIELEKDSYAAIVYLKIQNDIAIPEDSRAIISTSGLIGDKYIAINPGISDTKLTDQGKLVLTQSSLNIEELISKLIYSFTSK